MNGSDEDPQPGEFDAYLDALDPSEIEHVDADSTRRLLLQVTLSGDDTARLSELAEQRGSDPSDVLSSLIRSA